MLYVHLKLIKCYINYISVKLVEKSGSKITTQRCISTAYKC